MGHNIMNSRKNAYSALNNKAASCMPYKNNFYLWVEMLNKIKALTALASGTKEEMRNKVHVCGYFFLGTTAPVGLGLPP
jgi:hypothetical protein